MRASAPATVLAAGTALFAAPSVLVLGQWSPLRVLPGDTCRWRGPQTPGVALTFDDGPDESSTPRILDRLDELGLRGTFFCLGELVDREPALVKEIARRGHQVESHGHRHEHHLARSPRWVRFDTDAAVDAMSIAGIDVSWYRPPYGQMTAATLLAARRHRLKVVLWSAWGREWTTTEPAAVAARVARGLEPGAIVLMHDSDVSSAAGTARVVEEALGPIADELDHRGLRAVTLDELVGAVA
jgi:peptidoglycan/xylan/chitin deacetylase (PgdA/CDA1 family)